MNNQIEEIKKIKKEIFVSSRIHDKLMVFYENEEKEKCVFDRVFPLFSSKKNKFENLIKQDEHDFINDNCVIFKHYLVNLDKKQITRILSLLSKFYSKEKLLIIFESYLIDFKKIKNNKEKTLEITSTEFLIYVLNLIKRKLEESEKESCKNNQLSLNKLILDKLNYNIKCSVG